MNGVTIGLLTLTFLIMSAILGILWKGGKEVGKIGQKVEDIASNSNKTAESLDRHIQWHLSNRRGIIP